MSAILDRLLSSMSGAWRRMFGVYSESAFWIGLGVMLGIILEGLR